MVGTNFSHEPKPWPDDLINKELTTLSDLEVATPDNHPLMSMYHWNQQLARHRQRLDFARGMRSVFPYIGVTPAAVLD